MSRGIIVTSAIEQPLSKQWAFVDMSNKTIGRLKVMYHVGGGKWLCECTCGSKIIVGGGHLRSGDTSSCGCLHTERTKKSNTRHGESYKNTTTEYIIYCGIRERCNNKNYTAYKDYGGRGIQCKFPSYQEFLNHVGRRPSPKHTLDRINNDGNYEPGNVRWATWKQQGRNTRKNRLITIDNVTKCQSEWSEVYGITTKMIDSRRRNKWCDKCAVTVPNIGTGRHKISVCNHK